MVIVAAGRRHAHAAPSRMRLRLQPGARVRLAGRRRRSPARSAASRPLPASSRRRRSPRDGLRRRSSRAQSRLRRVAVAGDKVELADADLVGERDLPHPFVVLARGRLPVDRVNERQNARDPVEPVQRRLRQERLQHRARLGQARGLDHDIVEIAESRRPAARGTPELSVPTRSLLHRAAEAAVLQHDDGVGAAREQLLIEPDLAELVDDDERPAPVPASAAPR